MISYNENGDNPIGNTRETDLSSLLQCVGAVLKYPQFRAAAREIFIQCKQLIGAGHGYVALLSDSDHSTHEVMFFDEQRSMSEKTAPLVLQVQGMAAYIYQTGTVFYDNDFLKSEWANLLPEKHLSIENILLIPIRVNEKVAGLLAFANKPGGFTEYDVQLGTYFGEFASIALRNKRSSEQLKESEERYRRLIEIIPDAIIISSGGKVVFANAAAARLFGARSAEALIGSSSVGFVQHHSRQEVQKGLAELHSRNEATPPRALQCMSVDGTEVDVEVVATPLVFQGAPAELVVLRDISLRKRMEGDVLQATKLEAVSVLAGGVAHDFNNLLTVVLGNLSIAKMYAAKDTQILRKLKEIENAAQQTKELTRQLLTLAKGATLSKKVVSLEDFLQETASFVVRGTNVNVSIAFADDLPPVDIDAGQFSQVMNNLLINAIQAMPEGGTIRICAETLNIIHNGLLFMLEPGRYIKISVSDEGCGIAPEDLSKIFEPFFTTKEEGTGLGLATSYNIVRQHGGHLAAESEVGVGTTFHIYLPVSSGVLEQQLFSESISPGHGKILLMDDEENVRKMAKEMLNILGYEVDFAADGEEAVVRYLEEWSKGRKYDLVILDKTVRGGMGGQQAIKKLRDIDPEVKAVISSGYATSDLLTDPKKYGFKECISKPYKIEELSSVLQKVLE
ncbi:hybrid sensor histidine kinase/response regulator [Dethiobacter alkaliphilus]|uniref:hybrid sensor histidine kinase/response regulator n=1 Tax=Dethiobacter alkaliphilus TaxID=427926 RepID=UPI002226F44D|nr:ATP-binding protein [Dethiobacter alkaliphilus]MCW3490153.1 ATP-binding protein [Dethiobacter alkaliphilus]